ncbi:MAG: hypothetical protein J6T10_26855 [Methanobrevibacter sp.]|nr:hypothetical protein [Methanobrevibacter sp.]
MTFQQVYLTDTNQITLFDEVTNQHYVLNIFRTTDKDKKLVNEIRFFTANEKEPQKVLYKTGYLEEHFRKRPSRL